MRTRTWLSIIASVAFTVGAACQGDTVVVKEEPSDVEKAAEEIGDAADAIGDAGAEIGDAVKDIKDAAEDDRN